MNRSHYFEMAQLKLCYNIEYRSETNEFIS